MALDPKVKSKILKFVKSSGERGVQNVDVAQHIGGRLEGPRPYLEELVSEGEVYRRNDLIYWSFVHKDFK